MSSSPSIAPELVGTPIRVLHIDDNHLDATLIAQTLSEAGYDVIDWRRVNTGEDLALALDLDTWDVVLCDHTLAELTWLRAFDLCRDRAFDVPFIVISGTAGEELAVEAMREGVHDYFLKDKLSRLPSAIAREMREARNREHQRQLATALDIEARRYRSIFNSSAASLWEVNLSRLNEWFADVRVADGDDFDALMSARPDALIESAKIASVVDVNDTTLALWEAEQKTQLLGGVDRLLSLGFRTFWPAVLHAIASGLERVQTEVDATSLKGSRRRVVLAVQLPNNETLDHVMIAAFDVTDRALMERQMRAAQRMEAVGQLTGGVAHDFNNVLTAIKTYAAFARDALSDASIASDVDVIVEAADRAARLTKQLLSYSREHVDEAETVDANETVTAVADMLRRVIGETIRMTLDLPRDIRFVRASVSQLEQVVMNLAVNARDAMPNGGNLTIETRNIDVPLGTSSLDTAIVPGRYVLLAVTDDGVGMTPEVRANIFEPFFTTKEHGKGTGLGLATVLGIVKQLGGQVLVQSEVGRGTTFRVYLPAADPSAPLTAKRLRSKALGGSGEVVLVIDDDHLVRKPACRILASHGYRVVEAASAKEAIEQMTMNGSNVTVLLTDVVIPGMTGPQIVRHMRLIQPLLRVVYMSGYPHTNAAQQKLVSGSDGYLQKPFDADALLRMLRNVLDA